MQEADREGRVEHDGEPVGRLQYAVHHLVAGRGVQERVGRQDPEGGDRGADRDGTGGGEVDGARHLVPAEQHDAEEAGLEEEGHHHLVAQQRPEDAAADPRQLAPVGAELVGHDDAGDHADAEGDGEDLDPELVQGAEFGPPGLQPQRLEHRQPARHPNGEGREQEVERHHEGELEPRQEDRIEIHGNSPSATGRGRLISWLGKNMPQNRDRYHGRMTCHKAPAGRHVAAQRSGPAC